MASAKEILEMDIYALLGVESTATAKQIKKAYRQRALSCHPDKNPDNPRAAELFHQLSQALEVLTDAAARAAYDKVRAAKKQAEERNQKLDSKRKKIKLDLEAREKRAETEKAEDVQTSRSLEEEIARLREQGSRELQEQQRLMQEQIQRERHTHTDASSAAPRTDVTPKLKLRWRCSEGDSEYSQQSLLALFQKYGDVMNVLISSKKKGSAVVEFSSARAADLACQNESGLMGNPLRVSWLEGRPAVESGSSQSALRSERDYESLVLMQLRRAEERRRLMEEMRKEEEEQQHY